MWNCKGKDTGQSTESPALCQPTPKRRFLFSAAAATEHIPLSLYGRL